MSPETTEVSVKSQLPGSLFFENPQHSVESSFRSQAAESVAVSAPCWACLCLQSQDTACRNLCVSQPHHSPSWGSFLLGDSVLRGGLVHPDPSCGLSSLTQQAIIETNHTTDGPHCGYRAWQSSAGPPEELLQTLSSISPGRGPSRIQGSVAWHLSVAITIASQQGPGAGGGVLHPVAPPPPLVSPQGHRGAGPVKNQ